MPRIGKTMTVVLALCLLVTAFWTYSQLGTGCLCASLSIPQLESLPERPAGASRRHSSAHRAFAGRGCAGGAFGGRGRKRRQRRLAWWRNSPAGAAMGGSAHR